MTKRHHSWQLYLRLLAFKRVLSSTNSAISEFRRSSPDLVHAALYANNLALLASGNLARSIQTTLQDELSTLTSPAGTAPISQNGSGIPLVRGQSASLDLTGVDDGTIRTILAILQRGYGLRRTSDVDP